MTKQYFSISADCCSQTFMTLHHRFDKFEYGSNFPKAYIFLWGVVSPLIHHRCSRKDVQKFWKFLFLKILEGAFILSPHKIPHQEKICHPFSQLIIVEYVDRSVNPCIFYYCPFFCLFFSHLPATSCLEEGAKTAVEKNGANMFFTDNTQKSYIFFRRDVSWRGRGGQLVMGEIYFESLLGLLYRSDNVRIHCGDVNKLNNLSVITFIDNSLPYIYG